MSAASTYPTDAEAKAQIIEAGLKIYQRGLVAANDGNLSVRVGENALWVTPTGVSKGFMTEDMLVKLDLDGNVLAGTRKASSETKMHLRIYQENPDVRAVVHAHPPAATAFAAAGIPLDRPVLQEAVALPLLSASVERRLQNHHRRLLVDHRTVLASADARIEQLMMCGHCRQTLIHQFNGGNPRHRI